MVPRPERLRGDECIDVILVFCRRSDSSIHMFTSFSPTLSLIPYHEPRPSLQNRIFTPSTPSRIHSYLERPPVGAILCTKRCHERHLAFIPSSNDRQSGRYRVESSAIQPFRPIEFRIVYQVFFSHGDDVPELERFQFLKESNSEVHEIVRVGM